VEALATETKLNTRRRGNHLQTENCILRKQADISAEHGSSVDHFDPTAGLQHEKIIAQSALPADDGQLRFIPRFFLI
jgi:hypothetical protein